MVPQAPCKGCRDRHCLCHSHCENYISYKEEITKYNKERSMERSLYAYSDAHVSMVNKKIMNNKR